MIEVNRKTAILAVALFAVAMMVAPVFAASPKWIPVTVTRTGMSATFPTKSWTAGNTLHARGGTGGFANFVIVGEGVNLQGHSESTFDFNINLENGRGVWHWDITIIFPDGTFEGIAQVTGTYSMVGGMPVSSDSVQIGTFCGTGAYQGWTLKITSSSAGVEASMLIP